MADKLTQLLLAALGKAALAPAGLPLHATRATPGLFPATAAGKSAAQKSRDEGLLADTDGAYTATSRGLAFLEEHTSPKQVLDDLARAVESRREQLDELIATTRQMTAEFSAIQGVLHRLSKPDASARVGASLADASGSNWLPDARAALGEWPAGTAGDLPLPALYRQLAASHPALTVGQFHDGLRRLHDSEEIYLHPWTGPLYALPEPAFALMIGHEIAYYASPRQGDRCSVIGERHSDRWLERIHRSPITDHRTPT